MNLKILNQIVDFLISSKISLSEINRDGRLNSAINEDKIIDLIQKNLILFMDRNVNGMILHMKKIKFFIL